MPNILHTRILLEEPENLPNAKIEEPIIISTEPDSTSENVEENNSSAFVSMLNDAIANEWTQIEMVKSYITTISSMSETSSTEDIISILNNIVDEKTIHVGMYQKAIELLDTKPIELIDKGESKATEIINDLE